ncbi:hypothetical protein, partial [Luteimonas sp. 9C]|uniref:hypothetical protein n=1 Tax=Luteimonas sp. 9C TaxID=2653148 RepID=UPI001F3F7010
MYQEHHVHSTVEVQEFPSANPGHAQSRGPETRSPFLTTFFQPGLSLSHSLEFPRSIALANPAQRKTPAGIPAGVLGKNPGDDLLS